MSVTQSGFFKFIDCYIGRVASHSLKMWSHTNRDIIKTNCKIFFLRECKVNNLVPQHMSKAINTNITFFDNSSSLTYTNFVQRMVKRLLNIEISDAFKFLRFFKT